MTTQSSNLITSVLLSRDELLVILNLLNSGPLPGLAPAAIENLTAEQQAYGLVVAEQALRARGLARIDDDAHLQVRQDVLEMIGSCVYADGSQVVSLIESPSGMGEMLFIYRREDHFVIQTTPEPGLSQFQMQGTRAASLDVVLKMCPLPPSASNGLPSIVTEQQRIAEVREYAANGQTDEAISLLVTNAVPPESAGSLVTLLAKPHRIVVFQNISFIDDDSASVQSVTLLFDDEQIWLAVEDAPSSDEQTESYTLWPTDLTSATAYLSLLQW